MFTFFCATFWLVWHYCYCQQQKQKYLRPVSRSWLLDYYGSVGCDRPREACGLSSLARRRKHSVAASDSWCLSQVVTKDRWCLELLRSMPHSWKLPQAAFTFAVRRFTWLSSWSCAFWTLRFESSLLPPQFRAIHWLNPKFSRRFELEASFWTESWLYWARMRTRVFVWKRQVLFQIQGLQVSVSPLARVLFKLFRLV